jgi:dTDP-4-amino-4,6-dideoxygalactose transaminase
MDKPIFCSNPKMQFLAQEKEIIVSVMRVLNSDSYILGSEVSNFEKEFAAYIGVSQCVGVNSGTDALILSLTALNISKGDEVITPSHTAVATVAAIVACGATPIFVDIDPISYTIDPISVRQVISTKTKAIIAVHLYGHPCDMDELMQITNENNIYLIEDCAQAHGAKWRNRHVGTFGVFACFSFYPTKNLGAIGDGGAVVTNNISLADSVRQLRQYGWDSQKQAQSQSSISRLDEIQAAILRVKLTNLEVSNEKRRQIASKYSTLLDKSEIILPVVSVNAEHAFHLYVVQSENRNRIISHLNENKIYPGIHYPNPVHLQPAYLKSEKDSLIKLSVTEGIRQKILSLPMYPELTQNDIERICEQVLTA